MSGRVFDGRIARGIAPDDRARQDRLKATARALVTAVRDGLVRDGVVRLHGFGTFRLRPVAARRGRHPRTGEPIDIPAGWRVMFRPAKALRERVEPDRAPALAIGEPHASREAVFAASPAVVAEAGQRSAGRIPADGPAVPQPEEPRRAAAAAMPETRISVHGPIPSGPENPPEPADLEADSRVTRSPAALTRAPAADEPPPVRPPAASPDVPQGTETDNPSLRRGYRSALLVLVVVLFAGLAWLLRPVDSPVPPVAEEPATSISDPVSADAGSVSQDSATDGGGSREGERAIMTAGPFTGQADTGAPVARADDAPVGTTSTAADEPDESTTAATGIPAPSSAVDAANLDENALTALSGVSEATTSAPGPAESAPANEGAVAMSGDADADTTPGAEGATAATGTPATDDDPAGTGAGDGGPYFSGRDYTVRRGDTLWDLADRHYVNPYYWPHIWNHNGGITNPDRLEVREGLWLPALEGEPRSLTAADRRSIAEGYLRLYRFFRAQGDANPQYALVGVRYFDASVLPDRLRGTAAGHPGDTLAAAFQARLEAGFPLD